MSLEAKQFPVKPLPPAMKIFLAANLIINQYLSFRNMGNQADKAKNPNSPRSPKSPKSPKSPRSPKSLKGGKKWQQYAYLCKSGVVSQIQPFTEDEIAYLDSLFKRLDRRHTKSIEVKDLDNIIFLRTHPLFSRLKELYEEELKKMKVVKLTFQIFMHFLSIFHMLTDIETKYKYLFRIYDINRHYKLTAADLVLIFEILFQGRLYTKDNLEYLASEAIVKFGKKGEIKFQQFREMVPQDEVKEVMTLRFLPRFH